MFSIVIEPRCIPTKSARGSLFSTSSLILVTSRLLMIAILPGVRWSWAVSGHDFNGVNGGAAFLRLLWVWTHQFHFAAGGVSPGCWPFQALRRASSASLAPLVSVLLLCCYVTRLHPERLKAAAFSQLWWPEVLWAHLDSVLRESKSLRQACAGLGF